MSEVPSIPASEITPKHLYLNRRRFMQATGTLVGGVLVGACNMPEAPEEAAAPPDAQVAVSAPPASAGAAG